VNRTLRDLITERVRELQRTLADTMAAAQQGVRLESAERDQRIHRLTVLLRRVERIGTQADRLESGLVAVR
jgi:hypothetical protein